MTQRREEETGADGLPERAPGPGAPAERTHPTGLFHQRHRGDPAPRARQHIEDGAVTAGYKADRETVVRILNEALATEIVCVLRYKRHYFMATGIHAQAVAARVPRACQRGAGPRRPDRGADHADRRRAELQPRGPRHRAATREYVEANRSST